ncbi:unnamed protein product [Pieris macdunnoughi]|uniref:Uncharacterized protein n=1 Tax=Pieris macdunnoughi TaxID=345717 RepID=A0A821WJL2_9NEOP|nr:unnamed protein product [Pieris macdunnoughi]
MLQKGILYEIKKETTLPSSPAPSIASSLERLKIDSDDETQAREVRLTPVFQEVTRTTLEPDCSNIPIIRTFQPLPRLNPATPATLNPASQSLLHHKFACTTFSVHT